MNYVYSLIRFVPDSARGEFINVGAIAGSEESSDWAVRQIGNPVRARALDDSNSLDAVWAFIDRLGKEIDQYQSSLESLFGPQRSLNEEWIALLHRDHRNIVQLTYPTPMIAESAEEALDKVFDLMIVDPSQRRYRFRKKNEVIAALRRAYRAHEIGHDSEMCEGVRLSTQHYQVRFDFAITNGEAVQLTHAWSFQVPNQDALAEQVKSWGWTVQDTQSSGGMIITQDGKRFGVSNDVDVEVVYILPENSQEAPALAEATSVFESLGVNQVPLEKVGQVAERAAALLGRSPSAGFGL